jgi:hypothetical protein
MDRQRRPEQRWDETGGRGPELFCENLYRYTSPTIEERAMSDAVAALVEAYFLLALTRRWLSTLARSGRPTSAREHVIAVHANSFTTFATGKGHIER